MQALIGVVLPVFLVIGAGWGLTRAGLFGDDTIDALMRFATRFAIPVLLFQGIAGLDLGADFRWPLLVTFYAGAATGFAAGLLGGRFLFGRSWEDAVVFGFAALFSNSVLLGLPIMERAYGAAALAPNYAIIAIHAPVCYALGVSAMELARAGPGGGIGGTLIRIGRAMFRNALVIGIAAGFAVNLSGLALPGPLDDATRLIARAALPVALFALGGVLTRYRPAGDARAILYLAALSLVLHPAVTWAVGRALALEPGAFASAVVTASMPPGINAYLFAALYGRAMRVAASTVLVATAASVVTAWAWLTLLGA
jgi:malonate transporter and related proteins